MVTRMTMVVRDAESTLWALLCGGFNQDFRFRVFVTTNVAVGGHLCHFIASDGSVPEDLATHALRLIAEHTLDPRRSRRLGRLEHGFKVDVKHPRAVGANAVEASIEGDGSLLHKPLQSISLLVRKRLTVRLECAVTTNQTTDGSDAQVTSATRVEERTSYASWLDFVSH